MVTEVKLEDLTKCLRDGQHYAFALGRLVAHAEPHADRINRYLKFPIETDPSAIFFHTLIEQLVKKMDAEGFK